MISFTRGSSMHLGCIWCVVAVVVLFLFLASIITHRFRISFSHKQASVGEQQSIEELDEDLKVLQNTCRPEIRLVKFLPESCLAFAVVNLLLFFQEFFYEFTWLKAWSLPEPGLAFAVSIILCFQMFFCEFAWLRAASFQDRPLPELQASCSPWSALPEISNYRLTRLEDARRLGIWTFQVFFLKFSRLSSFELKISFEFMVSCEFNLAFD